MMDSAKKSDALIMAEAIRLVGEGVSVTFPVNGRSMLPFIVGGRDSVILEKPVDLRVGDVGWHMQSRIMSFIWKMQKNIMLSIESLRSRVMMWCSWVMETLCSGNTASGLRSMPRWFAWSSRTEKSPCRARGVLGLHLKYGIFFCQ